MLPSHRGVLAVLLCIGCYTDPLPSAPEPDLIGRPDRLYTVGDTALVLGRSGRLWATVYSTTNKVLERDVVFTTDSDVIVIRDDSMTAMRYGIATVVAQGGGLSHAFDVAVVPAGRWLATRGDGISWLSVTAFDTDGRNTWVDSRRILYGGISGLAWLGDTGQMVYASEDELVRIDTAGEHHTIPLPPEGPVEGVQQPSATPDGAWIFFSATVPVAGRSFGQEIWRVRPDGQDYERVGPRATLYEDDAEPSPSPDGSSVVFLNWLAPGGASLFVAHAGSERVDTLDIRGRNPRWSPDGEWIAFAEGGRVEIVRPDGSDHRTIAPERAYSPAWSPDGEWLSFSFNSGRAFVNLETGETAISKDHLSTEWGVSRP